MMPTDVSLSASSSTFCLASSPVRSATRSSRPSSVSRSLPVMELNATASLPTSSLRRDGRLAVEVAGGNGLGGVRDREDRSRDPA